jgi:acyl dehydratase
MPVRELKSSPSMAGSFARGGLGAITGVISGVIPGASRVPLIGGRRSRDVPDVRLVLREVTVDRERLAAYDRVCGFGVSDRLPATYPHVLAFPLQLALMTDPSFPLPAIGLVHIANEITQHRQILAGEQLELQVWATALEPHPRGRQFSLRTEVRADGELVWEETSTNLHRGQGDESARSGERLPSVGELPSAASWTLPGDLGRRYASVSGDFNPIHIHPLTARIFGFPSAIAHGMWTKARCLAALEPRLPAAFTVGVAFRKPIVLPAHVTFAEQMLGGGIDFGVRDARKDTPHLEGRLKFAKRPARRAARPPVTRA